MLFSIQETIEEQQLDKEFGPNACFGKNNFYLTFLITKF
jgi:hypothetical protein